MIDFEKWIKYVPDSDWKFGWDEDDPTPESGDSDGDLIPPMDGDDDNDTETDD